MGPRPFGRGRVALRAELGDRRMRQWGRDRLAAEGPRPGRGLSHGPPASMGPRPFGRGRPLHCTLSLPLEFASMGPRPFGRGRTLPPAAPAAAKQASMGPRPFGRGRSAAGAEGPDLIPGVNGAATVWPRKESCRLWCNDTEDERQWGRDRLAAEGVVFGVMIVMSAARQWGRDRLAAEGCAPRRLHATAMVASMGPRPFGRGRPCPRPTPQFHHARQWGRDRLAAEGSVVYPRLVGRPGVNGAATVWPRKGRSVRPGAGRQALASMGPRPFGRGRRRRRCPRRELPPASMGPRPFGRGRRV